MDTQTLIQALRDLNIMQMEWKLAFYNTRKSRDGLQMEWKHCKMTGIQSWVDVLVTVLLEKTLAERMVTDYSPILPKEDIAALEKDNELIREQIWTVLADVKAGLEYSPDDFVDGTYPKPTGYCFSGVAHDQEGKVVSQVLFMRRSNPFLGGQRVRLCTTTHEEILTNSGPFLKFMPTTDFIYIGDICYFLSPSIEKDFELENRHFAIAARHMADIADAGIINDYEQLEQVVYSPKNAKKFLDFDKQVLEHITQLGVMAREEFLIKYGITVDSEGRMETYDSEQCELIIDLLCGRSCLDALGRLAVGSNITPRE